MATTSIWRVHGYIGKVLLYAKNPDKTTVQESITASMTQSEMESQHLAVLFVLTLTAPSRRLLRKMNSMTC